MKLCLVSQLALVVSFLPPALAQDVESSLFSASTSHHQINNAFAAPTLVELTASNPHLSTLVMAKHSADFSHLLGNTGKNYTFFAPDNNAFNYLQQQTPELARALFTAPWLDHLQNLLSFHIVDSEQAIHTSSVQESTTVHTLAGEPVYLTPYQDALYIWPALHGGYARVVTPDNGSANGVAHYVDAILMPSWLTRSIWQTISAANMRDLTTFKRLIDKADLGWMLAQDFGLTLLAPTNEAFAEMDTALLQHLESPQGKQDLIRLVQQHIVASVLPSYLILIGTSDVATKLDGVDLSLEGSHIVDEEEDGYNQEEDDEEAHEPEVTDVLINGKANIETYDILAANGMVHVIDAVLLPPPLPKDNQAEIYQQGNYHHHHEEEEEEKEEHLDKAEIPVPSSQQQEQEQPKMHLQAQSKLEVLTSSMLQGKQQAPRASGKMNLRRGKV